MGRAQRLDVAAGWPEDTPYLERGSKIRDIDV